MKKILTIFAALTVFASSLFGFEFRDRYFELYTHVPVNVSNSAFFLNDIMKREVVIDLKDFAAQLPPKGITFSTVVVPENGFNLNLDKVRVNGAYGVDVQGSFNLPKEAVEFVANGNKLNEDISVNLEATTDVFFYLSSSVKILQEKYSFTVAPTLFMPVTHCELNNAKAVVRNSSDGTFGFEATGEAAVYSPFDMAHTDNFIATDAFGLIMAGAGFDLAGAMDYEILPGFRVKGFMQCPLIPGRLNKKSSTRFTAKGEVNVSDVINGKSPEGSTDTSDFTTESANFIINRPFRISAGCDWYGLGKWLICSAEAGFAVKYPFTEAAVFYPEYDMSVTVCGANIASVQLGSQYQKQVFSHYAGFRLNARVFELDWGVSASSPSFVGSFCGGGFGAYVSVRAGF